MASDQELFFFFFFFFVVFFSFLQQKCVSFFSYFSTKNICNVAEVKCKINGNNCLMKC